MSENNATDVSDKKKSHRERKSGRKAERKKKKGNNDSELTARERNPKAFAFNSAVKAERRFRHRQDIETKKQHIPLVDRTPLEPPPILVGIVGPPKVGKSALVSSLVKLFTKTSLTDIKGPVTIVTGKKRRITLIECNNDVNSMIDLAKVADLILLLCDASFGFEMEVFEFLNICQVHGMPRIMGVLTHLDMIKNSKTLKTTKKTLKHRFWTEVYPGAKLFYLSGILHGEYLRNEIKNLGRFMSVIKLRPLVWRTTHSYLVGDRYEDLTSQELIRKNPKCDRNISLYGYVRGIPLNKQVSVHIAGLGDLPIHDISHLPDPCPLPEALKKRALVEKEKLIYAPFSGVGGIVYDKDAVYVELGGSHSHKQRDDNETSDIVSSLIRAEETLDVKMEHSTLQLFTSGKKLTAKDLENIEEEPESEVQNKQLYVQASKEETELDTELESLRNIQKIDVKTDAGVRRKVVFEQNDDDFLKSLPNDESGDDDSSDDDDRPKPVAVPEPPVLKGQGSNELHKKLTDIIKKLDSKDNQPKNINDGSSSGSEDDVDSDEERSGNKERMPKDYENYDSDEDDSDSDQENPKFSDGNEGDEDGNQENEKVKSKDMTESNEDDKRSIDASEDEDGNEEDLDVKWKDNLAKMAMNYQNRKQNLMKVVYGVFDNNSANGTSEATQTDQNEEDEIGGLFRVAHYEKQKAKLNKDNMDLMESSLFETWDTASSRNWLDPENKNLIVNCFVTGTWKDTEDAAELLKLDDAEDMDSEDSEVFGDFEDLETGQKFTSGSRENPSSHEGKRKRSDEPDELTDKKALAEKKRKLKEKFDVEYDNTDKSYYDELKSSAEKQSQLNKTMFEDMPDDLRIQIEGYRPGMYVRIEFQNVPAEFINNFDPTYPLLVGALNMSEENIGFVNVKIKKHRWYKRILKTNDPVIISLGWRRFQTVPLYSKLEDDLKFRYLKYTPEHVTCNAHFWGPVTPQGTGFLALQSCDQNPETLKQGFRIAATGAVQELDKSTQIMKKLKLIGYPLKIYKKTAFIKGMFSSALEVARFEGAQVKTVSGVRGQIKKAVSKPEGAFRATFEDKIQLSDIVFCRTWFKVNVPQFYNPVITLLLPPEKKNAWRGARTTGQIKREEGIRNQPNKDSLFTDIVREPKVFKPLVVPRKLQRSLPYKDKPRYGPLLSDKKKPVERVAVIREPHEQKVSNMMKMLRASFDHKQAQIKLVAKEKMEKYKKQIEEQQLRKVKKLQSQKKQVMRARSKAQKKR